MECYDYVSEFTIVMMATLAKAQLKRPELRGKSMVVVNVLGRQQGREAFNVYEVEEMLKAINLYRETYKRPLVDIQDIWRADQLAAGHSDYPEKMARYCADIAIFGEIR